MRPARLEDLREEITRPSVVGPAPTIILENLVERYGGRFIPEVDVSLIDYVQLTLLCRALAQRGKESLLRARLPTPKQMSDTLFNLETGCWERQTSEKQPYGQLTINGIDDPGDLAHRSMFLAFFGPQSLPAGSDGSKNVLDHVCENKSCCYPRHLEAVTQQENIRRGRVPRDGRPGPEHGIFEF